NDTSNVMTLRLGRYGRREQVTRRDYTTSIPESGRNAFAVTTVPLTDTIAQDVLHEILEVELTKEVRLARHVPDPNRFRRRPLGLPSNVSIAAITFEKSPLQMRIGSGEAGHAF